MLPPSIYPSLPFDRHLLKDQLPNSKNHPRPTNLQFTHPIIISLCTPSPIKPNVSSMD
ncbi:hypothetical protein PGT21_001197 [Puccinia graminis f. sp. tritici]|uniref:Uncharacterized protein n=1 Tax=Puccinia graminis f. sp. tritici TaxID=56615 RepID=A0A5B0MJB0_PUCGR|nr:hypothetical protein PGT21_001197 [Puccinia graminis f. sp. tritici]KAA1132646.1 hypothetical protein PGTUg99_004973 [Puccinia graminis f. sp. tritici]KAA1135666.1 hypothetical protein PGTUg99_029632 [Puccinia graminis f. sp. tritici]